MLNVLSGKYYWLLSAYGVLLFLMSLFILLKREAIYLNVWVHDNFTYLDGAYRILRGQTPHLDFITPIGSLGYLLPYAGLRISNSYVLALPAADLLVLALVIVFALAIARKRLGVIPAFLLLTYVWLLVAVPINAGDTASNITYSMFYNRDGWALLLIFLILYLELGDPAPRDKVIDIIASSLILLFLFYLKISFFAVGLASLPLLAFKSKYHCQVAIICVITLLVGMLCVELICPGITIRYVQDLLLALQSSGAVRGDKYTAINLIYRNIGQILLVLFVVGLSAKAKPLRWIDFVFIIYILVTTSVLLNQNAQTRNLVTLFVVSIWGLQRTISAVAMAQSEDGGEKLKRLKPLFWGVLALSIMVIVPPFATRLYGMAIMYARSKPMPVTRAIDLDKLRKVFVYQDQGYLSGIDKDQYANNELYIIRKRLRRDWLTVQEYVETIEDGVNLLKGYVSGKDSIIVMDMVNPFSFLMDTRPPRNSYSFLHLNRTFNLDKARPNRSMLADASIVMIPHYPIEMPERDALLKVFGPALQQEYRQVAGDRYWTVLRRKAKDQPPPDQAGKAPSETVSANQH